MKEKTKKKNIEPLDTESLDDENYYIMNMDRFENSKPKEDWVQCLTYTWWAHEACTTGVPYICHHSESDADHQ